jgi:hypothetical protein
MATTCPKCGNAKGIKKLSVIIKDAQEEALIKRLAAPMNPQKAVKPLNARDSLIFIGFAFTTTTFLLSLQNKAITATVIYGIMMAFFLVGIVRMLLNYIRTRKVADALTPAWRDAALIWNRLWYCVDDDLVFDPKTGESAAPQAYHQALLHYPPQIPGITAPKEKRRK